MSERGLRECAVVMNAAGCQIEVEVRADGTYRARCTFLPDAEAIAATEAEARQAIEAAIEQYLRQRMDDPPEESLRPTL